MTFTYNDKIKREFLMRRQRSWILAFALAFAASATAEPIGFAVNSDDQSDTDQLMRVDLATGQHSFVGRLPSLLADVEGMAFAASGELFAVDSATRTLVQLSEDTGGARSVNGSTGNLGFPQTNSYDFGMTFTCSGELLLVAEQTGSLYTVDTESGAARVVGASGGLGDTMTAIAAYGDDVFALAADSGRFYRVDAAAGTAALVGTIDAFEITDAGMAFDEEGVLWAISSDFGFDQSRIFIIDPFTADIAEVARTRPGVESLAIGPPSGCGGTLVPAPQVVPVNSPWGLALLIGLFLILAARRLPRRA